jgi:Ca2+-binding EF-hand superfamily protein
MRRKLGILGTMAIGMTAFAPGNSIADDKSREVGVGPIQNIHDLQETGKMLFKLADTNNDGQISQKEATDAGNLLVGGFFFRADTNGDGTLSADEAKQARESLFAQQPLLRLIVQKAKPTNGEPANNQPVTANGTSDPAQVAKQLAVNPARTIGSLLDTNHDQKLEATELRQAVQTGVQTLFSIADTNQDAQLSPYELNSAVGEAAKSAVQTVFQAADADRNGSLSMDEYDKALAEPAHAVFRVIDANGDNMLSLAELQRAEQILRDQVLRLRVPEPANSLSHQIQNGPTAGRTGDTNVQPVTGAATAPATVAPAPR